TWDNKPGVEGDLGCVPRPVVEDFKIINWTATMAVGGGLQASIGRTQSKIVAPSGHKAGKIPKIPANRDG
ncbi:MAG TPA: hypothetical protein VKQ29_00680, partial [Aliidongia sp.]|nr:hypothetical protein [Aliidongia sp.]